MKIIYKTSFIAAFAAMLTTAPGCKKLLVEEPRSEFYPTYFSTPGGIKAGLTGVYSDLRGFYQGEGQVHYYMGTDESQSGGSANPGAVNLNLYTGINSSNTIDFAGLWSDINTLNGVLQYAETAALDAPVKAQYIAQAKFLRAYCYFHLVQTYGGTTATQKSGIPLHKEFITAATTADAPAPLADIYNFIIQDFTDAAAGLPATITASNLLAGVGKTATSASAKAYLAKAYLTRGYLSEVAQSGDFQKAADLTAELISNKGTYGLDLFQDYNDVTKPANDYGKETVFAIDFGFADPTYSGRTEQGTGGFGLNNLPVLHRWNYISLAGVDNSTGIDAVPQKINTAKQPMQRDVYNGRPYIRVAPWGPYTAEVAFADQVHDTRWDATFQTFWICNKTVAAGVTSTGGLKGVLVPTTINSLTSYQPPINGDTAILMPGVDVTMARRDAFKGLIVTPKQYSNNVFPVVKKFDDILRTGMNDFSSRPIVLMRFSEVYLMNAEANYMAGKLSEAAASLNVIRQRAAFRTPADAAFIPKGQFSVTSANQATANAANAAAMLLTPAQVAQLAVPNSTTPGSSLCGMDLILEEYTRELYGDPRRWYDLVRTRQLVRRVKMYNSPGAANVQEFHMRRPIPQTQINAVLTGPKYPQNNGY
ncbi:RagB/SusD family nutrient uptake outer membrane protein [Pedobacter duraquae]|uniref:Putative outer membrane starch-binding protein n=1 Tax=Pedobacter duraquae TaxID=425511 RepID=A0A4R6IKX1_9SPHI|nr:RagB/SusD family nutrient uptake outer membrane protein [Pedobacter duraquae]TDO22707.1 putative outer membrane starch-binding protein [Pedobacter duraquae]